MRIVRLAILALSGCRYVAVLARQLRAQGITVMAPPDSGAGGGADPGRYIDAQVRASGSDCGPVAGIRSRARDAHAVADNVADLATVRHFAGDSTTERQAGHGLSPGFASAGDAHASQGVSAIDLMCSPQAYASGNYSSDFHPNDSGFAFMAAEALRAVTTSSYPAPQAAYPPMTTAVPGRAYVARPTLRIP